MSFGAFYIDVLCKCGVTYKEDFQTLGIKHGKCGLCMLKDYILENDAEKVAVVLYIVSNPAKKLDYTPVELVKKLCSKYVDDMTILNGIQGIAKEEVFNFLNQPRSNKAFRIKQDLQMYLEQRSIEHLVAQLFEK